MSQAAASDPVLVAIEKEARVLVWKAFDMVKDQHFTIHLHIFGIPFSPTISISNFKPLIELLAGPEVDAITVAADPTPVPAPTPPTGG